MYWRYASLLGLGMSLLYRVASREISVWAAMAYKRKKMNKGMRLLVGGCGFSWCCGIKSVVSRLEQKWYC